MSKSAIEFIYKNKTWKPKRLKNNVFVLYAPEKIRIRPGEIKNINMKLKIRLQRNIVGCCKLVKTFSENGIKLMNSQYISTDSNFSQQQNYIGRDNLPPWNLSLEIFNRNMNSIFQVRKNQEMGFFVIINERGEEIRHMYKKEQ